MNTLRKLLRLPRGDVRLLTEAAALVLTMRLGVSLLPFRAVRRLAARPAHRRDAAPRDRTVWAVRSVARRVPGATCLVQALAAHALLSRHGHPSRLCLGVRHGETAFEAHAWVEDGAEVLIGDGPVAEFSRLPLETMAR